MQQSETLAPAARLGAELRAAREQRGWALPELAQGLRIRQAYLEAIETGRVADLPGPTYAVGFLRAYAAALGLPAEEVARRFRDEAQVERQPALSFPVPVPQRGVPAGALMLLGLVILGAAYGGWYWLTEHRAARVETVPPIPDRLAQAVAPPPSPQVASLLPSTAAPVPHPPGPASQPSGAAPSAPGAAAGPGATTPPVAVTTGTAPAASAGGAGPPSPAANAGSAPAAGPAAGAGSSPATGREGAAPAQLGPQAAPGAAPAGQPAAPATTPGAPAAGRIVIRATADAWVTVKPDQGPAVFNRLMHAGDSWPVPADATDLRLTTGNAGGTEIDVDGKPIPVPLGGSGMVRRDLKLDPALLQSGQLPPLPARHARAPGQ